MTSKEFKWRYKSNDRLVDFICKNKLEYYLQIGDEIITLPKRHISLIKRIRNFFISDISNQQINLVQNRIFNLYNSGSIPFDSIIKRNNKLMRLNNMNNILEAVFISIVSSFIIYYLYDTNMVVNFGELFKEFIKFFVEGMPKLHSKDIFPFLKIIFECINSFITLFILIFFPPAIMIYTTFFIKIYNLSFIFIDYELKIINKKLEENYNL